MSSAQNIYDDPSFFEGYEKLRRTAMGLNEVLEQPALRSMLPKSLKGMRILDLGCGFGDFARKARREGACAVVGIDISFRMLERAIALTDDPAIEYRHASIEQLALDHAPYANSAPHEAGRAADLFGRASDVHCTAPTTMDKGRRR
jgi:ubiquinone/menaquinone biosynthesis C-methylase UbiE